VSENEGHFGLITQSLENEVILDKTMISAEASSQDDVCSEKGHI